MQSNLQQTGWRFLPLCLGLGATLALPLPSFSQASSFTEDKMPGEASKILRSQSCRLERQLRSQNSNVSTQVQFVNRSNTTLKVYWIDFAGKRQHYFDLSPQEARWQQTYVTHPWIITEVGANQPCVNIFLPTRAQGMAILN